MSDVVLAVGLMSGTSLDGVDAALIETDGEAHVRPLAFRGEPYSEAARATLRAATELALAFDSPRPNPEILAAEDLVTRSHILAVRKLLVDAQISPADVAVIGFHGQTIAHRPDRGWTWQIGDGPAMAAALGISVVNDLRSADVAAGGQGAPLLPVYHRALAAGEAKPLAILNLGGVGNITWIGEAEGDLIAFDTGPANGLIDDWMERHAGRPYDENGAFAATGRVDEAVLKGMLANPWFDQPPPKSLDRSDFALDAVAGLSPADGATTLTAFTALTVERGLRLLPSAPKRLIVAGGGRHNATLMAMLGEACGLRPEPIEALGWNGDATEAEGFAYMAVRSLKGRPISFPGTTGAPEALAGGVLHKAA
ncbi:MULTISPECIES: anhydro-N-acetylmuramic acid kinase [Sphingomonas]|uniref:Anhydro-N-acetylmuramic acid kinase n=1 Tax=Edaphosphingomonas fennica TaxID=114404 RepID=A0A2T4HR64_9SPHN|nr:MULTISPECIES: anhydro-N-acetylmuramic acid kinase [Sphingomonas]AGH48493.1 anhydro-N-acetylmuramic acid kinase [Sphingomonas sp. MM-1]MDX3883329.1 anhydro-N-acetylmuramic acid kinase [Sphingomonas sp.]PTD18272.1 anhydro-N-acetylmuramic acid kinase [Sphingomonas fennica]